MFGAVIGAVVGGVAGAVGNAMITNALIKKNAKAYRQAAKEVREAANKYSGQAAYNSMQNAGNEEANRVNQMSLQAQAAAAPENNMNKAANAANLTGNYSAGYNLGAKNSNIINKANYNAATAKAQQALNQANINYQAGTAAAQAAMNTAGGLTSLVGQIKGSGNGNNGTTSDSRQKEGINNNSGLPESDIEDSLRQLETVSYKYKDPSVPGCDSEVHDSGFTAQSLEKTPLGKDVVHEGADGVKRIDNWKLQEALMAGIAQLQREIDRMENNG